MITHTTKVLLGATALFMAGSLLAHDTKAAHQSHKDIEFTEVTATYKFQDGTKAEWTATPGDGYKVVLSQDTAQNNAGNDGGATSLLTVGIQGIDNAVEVTLLSGKGVEVKDSTKPNAQWEAVAVGATVKFPKVEAKPGNGNGLKDENIGFIRYQDQSCTLKIKSGKQRKGHTKWWGVTNSSSSHDNTPPGVPPGAEN